LARRLTKIHGSGGATGNLITAPGQVRRYRPGGTEAAQTQQADLMLEPEQLSSLQKSTKAHHRNLSK
jgi:hypothetical protein